MPNDKRRKRKPKVFRVGFNTDDCITVLRALELAKDWRMRTATTTEKAPAAMESADYVMLRERLLTEFIEQGLTDELSGGAAER